MAMIICGILIGIGIVTSWDIFQERICGWKILVGNVMMWSLVLVMCVLTMKLFERIG